MNIATFLRRKSIKCDTRFGLNGNPNVSKFVKSILLTVWELHWHWPQRHCPWPEQMAAPGFLKRKYRTFECRHAEDSKKRFSISLSASIFQLKSILHPIAGKWAFTSITSSSRLANALATDEVAMLVAQRRIFFLNGSTCRNGAYRTIIRHSPTIHPSLPEPCVFKCVLLEAAINFFSSNGRLSISWAFIITVKKRFRKKDTTLRNCIHLQWPQSVIGSKR